MDFPVIEKEFIPQPPASIEWMTEFLTNAIIEGRLKGRERLVNFRSSY